MNGVKTELKGYISNNFGMDNCIKMKLLVYYEKDVQLTKIQNKHTTKDIITATTVVTTAISAT